MGGPMTRNLLRAGYPVIAFDLHAERQAACVSAGATGAGSLAEVVQRAEFVLTSLPSSETFVQAAEEHLLPNARPGQVFLDLGTVTPPETRRLAAAFMAKGADLVDAPVSGGPQGAERARLHVFVGGNMEAVERCRPILEAIGGPERITHCGPPGAGQVVKGVNQLAMGLGAAAYLEAVAFGVRAGVEAEVIRRAFSSGEAWREQVAWTAAQAARGQGEQIGVKFRELIYFLREATEQGFALPLTEALFRFCDAGERVVIDDNRQAPSFWHELMRPRTRDA